MPDLENLDEATLAEVNELVPMYEELASTAKVHLLQSIVSRILVEMVFDAYFVGLSDEQTQQFRQVEKILSSYASCDEAINQWRSSTLTLLRRDTASLDESTSSVTEAVLTRITRVLDSLCGTSPSEARDSGLRVLVNNSIELARLLVVQKAVLSVYMPAVLPHQRVVFESETMEDLGGEDEEALAEREICCVAFPGVIKHGDENGGHLQYRNVIVKARVLCSPDSPGFTDEQITLGGTGECDEHAVACLAWRGLGAEPGIDSDVAQLDREVLAWRIRLQMTTQVAAVMLTGPLVASYLLTFIHPKHQASQRWETLDGGQKRHLTGQGRLTPAAKPFGVHPLPPGSPSIPASTSSFVPSRSVPFRIPLQVYRTQWYHDTHKKRDDESCDSQLHTVRAFSRNFGFDGLVVVVTSHAPKFLIASTPSSATTVGRPQSSMVLNTVSSDRHIDTLQLVTALSNNAAIPLHRPSRWTVRNTAWVEVEPAQENRRKS
ncbi:hypothetical protein NM208_g11593 [Fusarium decemcellulare]|uniref:Uncharacterized protein n=1 Tax=Fusarium decemcellulare TaxID=57161 RepID=A0ACC1RUR1_9HYPO|nr:hypothetical protein NM208_g11593 [Fusarium decemcellulare]